MVRVPTPEEEDRRRLSRERKALISKRLRHVNRIKGLLFSQGVSGYQPLHRDRWPRLEQLRTGDGRGLPPHLKVQISRELDRLELLLEQIKTVEAELRQTVADLEGPAPAAPAMLLGLRCIGEDIAPVLWFECFLPPLRQPKAGCGLCRTGTDPLAERVGRSGTRRVESGQSAAAHGAGPACLAVVRHQPDTALTRWFMARVEANGGRGKKTAIVALARKLLVALWKYVTFGEVIEGAVIRA